MTRYNNRRLVTASDEEGNSYNYVYYKPLAGRINIDNESALH